MADIELVEGEQGYNLDITIRNKDGAAKDLSSFTGATLKIKTIDLLTEKLSKTLTILSPSTNGIVRWAIGATDIPVAGNYNAQIILTGASLTVKTIILSVVVGKKLD